MRTTKTQLGWRFIRQSLRVLSTQKKLLWLSLAGRGTFFLIFILIGSMVWKLRSGKTIEHLSAAQIGEFYIFVLLLLWIGNIIAAFFNAAMTEVLIQQEKNQITHLGIAIKTAASRFWTIFIWIFAHFTLGSAVMLFRKQLSQSERINRLLSGLTWHMASFLIPPLIMNEPKKFLNLLERSSQLMYHFAGENPRINFSFAWLTILSRLLAIIPAFIAIITGSSLGFIIGLICTLILLMVLIIIQNAIHVIILQAIYQYTAHHKTIPYFRSDDLANAILGRD